MSLRVPATTCGGPCSDTGDWVSLSRALEESGSTLYDKRVFMSVCPENVVYYLYVCHRCPEIYIMVY